MAIRKNIRNLTSTEKADFIRGVKALKANGIYNKFVQRHFAAASRATPSTVNASYRNAAHKGPAFHPWHRQFMYKFEQALQSVVPGIALPYWDWTQDAANPDASPVWAIDFMGGNGNLNNNYQVETGPFGVGQWTIINENGQPAGGLQRRWRQLSSTLPSQSEVNTAHAEVPYDRSKWDATSSTSHRNRSEGWLGAQLHNKVHRFVGGSMLPQTSPNDPIFFLHHCNVDRLWAQWQAKNPTQGYQPITGGPPGHNIDDLMYPWDGKTIGVTATPRSVLDHKALGYDYA